MSAEEIGKDAKKRRHSIRNSLTVSKAVPKVNGSFNREKNRFEIKHMKFHKQEEVKCPASKRIEKETESKEKLEDKNAFEHKSVFDIKV